LGDKCGCQNAYLELVFYPDMRLCISTEWELNSSSHFLSDVDCLGKAWQVYSGSDSSILKKCDCPFECLISDYTYDFSVSEFPTLSFYRSRYVNNSLIRAKLGDQVSFERVRKSVASVRLYYSHLRETQIVDRIKFKPFDLLSSIGGTFGLFFGFDLLFRYKIHLTDTNKF
jgi:hypothetical protein